MQNLRNKKRLDPATIQSYKNSLNRTMTLIITNVEVYLIFLSIRTITIQVKNISFLIIS